MRMMLRLGLATVLGVMVSSAVRGDSPQARGGTTGARGGEAMRPSTTAARGKELTLQVGENLTMKLVHIAPGKFLMGAPANEPGRFRDEAQHEVTLTKGFYMATTHVTVDQFAAFVKATNYKTEDEKAGFVTEMVESRGMLREQDTKGRAWNNPGFEQKGDHPAVCISFNDATAFCAWLAEKSGKPVTLPTEAQWEYAARAGGRGRYLWGDNPNGGKGWANCGDASKFKATHSEADLFSWDDGFAFTSPVGSFKPNAWGLYDMVGNATQWCLDEWDDYKKDAVTDPLVKTGKKQQVNRGGAWSTGERGSRTAARSWGFPNRGVGTSGFRVVVSE